MQIFADMIINRTNSVTWSLMQSDLMVQSCNSRSWWNGRTEHLDNKWLHLLWPRLSNYVNSSNLIRQGQEPSAKMMCLQVKIFGFFCSKQQKATHKVKRFPSTIVGKFWPFFLVAKRFFWLLYSQGKSRNYKYYLGLLRQ